MAPESPKRWGHETSPEGHELPVAVVGGCIGAAR
jgi:hypothetical protein